MTPKEGYFIGLRILGLYLIIYGAISLGINFMRFSQHLLSVFQGSLNTPFSSWGGSDLAFLVIGQPALMLVAGFFLLRMTASMFSLLRLFVGADMRSME